MINFTEYKNSAAAVFVKQCFVQLFKKLRSIAQSQMLKGKINFSAVVGW